MQGLSEIAERHAICLLYLENTPPPVIPESVFAGTEVLKRLEAVRKNGLDFEIRDCSMGRGLPVIGLRLMRQDEMCIRDRCGAVRRCPKGFKGTQPDIDGVLFSITGRCNMRCRHCYMGAPAGQSELPLETLQHILDELCASGAMQLSLTGGEPLMRADLMELIDSILSRGIDVYKRQA